MAIRKIVTQGDEVLTKKCREVTEFNDRLHELLDDMADTLYESNGVGLAAPQVGILKRVVTIDVGDGLIELVNLDVIYKYLVDEQTIHKIVTLIEIYRAHHSLESIAIDVLLRDVIRRMCDDIFVQSDSLGHLVERLT